MILIIQKVKNHKKINVLFFFGFVAVSHIYFSIWQQNELTDHIWGWTEVLVSQEPVDLKMDLTMKAISRLHNKSIQKPEVDITMTLSIFIHCQCWSPRSRNKSWQAEEFKETAKKKKGISLSFRLFHSCVVTAKSLACLFFLSDGLHDNTCLRFGDRRKHGTEGAPPWGCSFGVNRLEIEPGTISPKARVNLWRRQCQSEQTM